MTSVLDVRQGKGFYRFANADGKVWLMPARHMRTAMNLYQPSGRKGILMKQWFPLLQSCALVRKVVRAEAVACSLQPELKKLLCELFHTEELEFAVFCGTPCVHQKMTIQLSKGNKILGYCKVTNHVEVAALFQGESVTLAQLNRMGLKGIPQCLYAGPLKDGIEIFVQDTVKTEKSVVVHHWGKLQENFLNQMQAASKVQRIFEETDYYQTLQGLLEHADWLPDEVNREKVTGWVKQIMHDYAGKTVDCMAYHADFTPWNMFAEQDNLFVFDWEYARLTYPLMLDRYHFFTQTAVFEKHWGAQEIWAYVNTTEGRWVDKHLYTLYLLEVMARFTVREKGHVPEGVKASMKLWEDLLENLCDTQNN